MKLISVDLDDQTLAAMVERTAEQDHFPLILGGDHSIAVGTVSGLSRHYQKQGQKIGLIWIDAHADMNIPETSPSGNVHGMVLAAALGFLNGLGRTDAIFLDLSSVPAGVTVGEYSLSGVAVTRVVRRDRMS